MEIGVQCDHHAILRSSAFEDGLVIGAREANG